MFTNNQRINMASLIHLFGEAMLVFDYSCSFVKIRVIRGVSRFKVDSFKVGACFAFLMVAAASAHAGIGIASARVWPAADYTRVTLESAIPVKYQFLAVKNPDRLVLDLEGVDLNAALEGLAGRVAANDPYIKLVRVARNKPGVVRVVLDLKAEVKPQLFTLPPYGEYGNRLVLDIYPLQPVDPLMALLEKKEVAAPDPDSAKEQAEKDKPAAEKTPELTMATALENASAKEQPAAAAKPAEKPAKPESVVKKLDFARLITVAIDAGHGGEDPGAHGKNGSNEKDVTLAIARRLKAQVDGEPNMRGVLIRDGDYFIPLHGRVVKARNIKADLFVSIHADAFVKPDASGSSVFALSERGATSAAARWLAKKENEADLIGGVNIDVKDVYLKQTLLDLSQTATINDSLKLGKAVLGELGGINRLHKGSVEQAGFAVLKSPDIPSILVETAFISNPDEEQKLKDDGYQDKMASAILGGIKRYFAKNPPIARSKMASAK